MSPRTETQAGIDEQDASPAYTGQNGNQTLINLGISYNIIAVVEGNLDSDQFNEQILIALPLNEPDANLELVIASAIPARNQYGVVWRFPLQTRTLTGITLNLDDITGDGRNELIVSGFDEKGFHITKIYLVPQNGAITDVTTVFDAEINGNIDIVPGARRGEPGAPVSIVVQEIDSRNNLDLIETTWTWDSNSYTFKSSVPRQVKIDEILEERMRSVYTGDVGKYEEYLSGLWYRENGSEASLEYLSFDSERDEILLHSGSIQEAYIWEESHRTTPKRLYTRLRNEIIPSIVTGFSINAESWNEIEIISNMNWAGNYHRLGLSLQKNLEAREASLSLMLTGVWQGQDDAKIVFDLPGIQWSENNTVRTGIASLFNLNDKMVLQVQFIKENGAMEEAINWIVEYEEESDPPRKSISLIQAQLEVGGARADNANPRRFEQLIAPESASLSEPASELRP